MSSPVLAARELRWQTRQALAAQGGALLSVTLRAPAALRQRQDYIDAFRALCQQMERQLALRPALDAVDADGPARHYFVQDPNSAKRDAIRFEEEVPGAALLDIDVMDAGGQALSRADLGLPARACAVCGGRPAALCVRGAAHDQAATLAAFEALRLLVRTPEARARHIGGLALKALLYEVSVSPKPGLVDRLDQGAHSDMDYYTFLDSALALKDYFIACALTGASDPASPENLLQSLRPLGLDAEQAMLAATRGANTHKGLIFSLGILCAAAGRLETASAAAVCALAADIAAPALQDSPGSSPSHGDKVRARHGDLGVRGEAAAGFPSALTLALPVLQQAFQAGLHPDQAGLRALLRLMAQVRDTNVLHRGGEEGLRFTQAGAQALLDSDIPPDALQTFCQAMLDRGLSPGGSADLLCLAFFLYFLQTT